MDALFVVVAELLLIPVLLWALIALELTLGVAASVTSVVLGRWSVEQAVYKTLRVVRRRLVWSMIFLSAGLLIADLVVFDALVALAVGHADDREALDIHYAEAEGSFILGRIELRGLTLAGQRGRSGDPSARFETTIDSLVVDIDTAKLLTARFAVQELSVDGVRGSFDRLHAVEKGKREEASRGLELTRDFALERLHFGDVAMTLRDHTKQDASPRELAVELAELDVGPLRSDTALFDLLYRVRGRGSVAGVGFTVASTHQGEDQTTLEVPALPFDLIGESVEASTGIRVGGSASLEMINRYREDPPEPRVELDLDLRLRELSLEPGPDAGGGAKLMLAVAERGLARLGADFPLHVELSLLRSELEGVRNLAESGLIETIGDAVVGALREELMREDEAK